MFQFRLIALWNSAETVYELMDEKNILYDLLGILNTITVDSISFNS